MTYWEIEAEVAGGLGSGVDYDVRRVPALLGTLHYEFEDWFGDDLVTTAGFWIVTGRLATALEESGLTGFELDDVTVSTSELWAQLPHEHNLPDDWRRLIPLGSRELGDDICVEGARGTRLVVSDAALALLRGFGFEEASVRDSEEPVPPDPLWEQFLAKQRERGNPRWS